MKQKMSFFLIMLFMTTIGWAQSKTVTGIVTEDSSGEPLPGVSVSEKGTSNGTITSEDGSFSINVRSNSSVLEFTFIGLKDKEVVVGNKSKITLSMVEDSELLEEVVVVGYGSVSQKDLTGTVTRVRPEATSALPNSNVLQSLKGNVSGLSIGIATEAGESPSMQIRGQNSLNASNNPLIVLDGIIYTGELNSIPVSDIETIDVLKDASAAAVYGSRSANGVIIITSKRGKTSKPQVRMKADYGVSTATHIIDMLGPEAYLQKVLDVRTAMGLEADPNKIGEYLTLTEANNLAAGRTIDWVDELIQTASTQNYEASVSGASESVNYYMSLSRLDQDGVRKNDLFSRTSGRLNLSTDITDWWTVGTKAAFSSMDYSGEPASGTQNRDLFLSPYGNKYAYDDEGNITNTLERYPMEDTYIPNPFLNYMIDDKDIRTELLGTFSSIIDVPFVKGLRLTTNYSIRNHKKELSQFSNHTVAPTTNGSGLRNYYETTNTTFDNILNYKKSLGSKNKIDATFLYSQEATQVSNTESLSSDFPFDILGYNSMEMGAKPEISSEAVEDASEAIMGRINYVWDNRVSATATYRRDGYSGFAEGHKYAGFFSTALAWTLSNETFLQDTEWLDYLKMRISYGENGNQAIGRYQTFARVNTDKGWGTDINYVFGDGGAPQIGVFVASMANNDLGWETTRSWNLGFDFGIFENVLRGSIDMYTASTYDMLQKMRVPTINGVKEIWTNLGEVGNKGVEVSLNSTNVKTSNFSWETGFTFALNRNKIISLTGKDLDNDGREDDVLSNSWFIGESLGAIFGYAIDGIYQLGDEIPSGFEVGDFRILDYNRDGELTTDDRHIQGYNTPNYQFSLSNTLKYKNFTLYVMINSIQGGGKYYKGNNIVGHNPNANFASWSERFNIIDVDYWTPDNPSNTVPRVDYKNTYGVPYLEDRSFVRIQDVILSYNAPKAFTDKIGLMGLKVFVSGKNLYTFTDWTGYDPESGSTVLNRPSMRTITGGVELSF